MHCGRTNCICTHNNGCEKGFICSKCGASAFAGVINIPNVVIDQINSSFIFIDNGISYSFTGFGFCLLLLCRSSR